jgi:hypothetical protein
MVAVFTEIQMLAAFSDHMPTPLNRFPPPVAEDYKKKKSGGISFDRSKIYSASKRKKLLRMKCYSWF